MRELFLRHGRHRNSGMSDEQHIVERFVRRADGKLEPVTEGSTKPIAETRTHAGIVKVRRCGFDIS